MWWLFCILLVACAPTAPMAQEDTLPQRGRAWRAPRGHGVLVLVHDQSNGFGFGNDALLPVWTSSTPALHSYYLKDADSASGEVYAQSAGPVALAPVNTFYPVGSGTPVTHASPALALVRALAAKGLPAHAVQVAQGGTEIAKFLPSYTPPAGNSNYTELVQRTRATLANLRASLGFVPESLLYYMGQGEQDVNFDTPAANYKADWLTAHEAFDGELASYEIRFVHRGLNSRMGKAHIVDPHAAVIRQAQSEICATFGATFLDTDSCNIDQLEGEHWKNWANMAHAIEAVNLAYPEYPHVVARTSATSSTAYWRGLGAGGFDDNFFGSATMSLVYTVRRTASGSSFTDEHQIHERYVANTVGFSARIGTGSTAKLLIVDGGAVSRTASMTVDLSDLLIHQIAWTFDGTTVKGYLDGVEQSVSGSAVTGYTAPSLESQLTIVGRHTSGSTSEFGVIHISASDTNVLSGTEIADIWTAAKASHNYDIPTIKRSRRYTTIDAGTLWTARDGWAGTGWISNNPGPRLISAGTPDITLEAAAYP